MNDDWRLKVTLHEHAHANSLASTLAASKLEQAATATLEDRVIVSRDGHDLFFYTATREQADRVRDHVAQLAGDHGWDSKAELRHWHPEAEDWESPDEPLPSGPEGRREEHEELIERERAESAQRGHPEFEVRIVCKSHGDAVVFAERLKAEGVPTARRWRYLIVGASDEDSAEQLAERLRAESPDGSEVTVEGSVNAALAERPSNPFSFLGGLGG